MLHKLHAFFSLSQAESWLFLQAWFTLLAADLGLRTLSFRRAQSLLAGHPPAASPAPADATLDIYEISHLLNLAARHHLYPMTCLRRALALQGLLARRGVPTRLRFGVQRLPEGINAHAWLEYNGRPINAPQTVESDYAVLAAKEASV